MSQPYPQPPRRPAPPGGGGFNRPPNPGRGPPPPPGPPGSSSSRGQQPPRPVPPPDLKIKPPASIFDENHLPSVLYKPNPMTPEAERQARRRTCRFIEEAGQRSLRLPRVAVATATVFFHRFYAKHAFQEHDRFEVAMACLLLAGKTEESPIFGAALTGAAAITLSPPEAEAAALKTGIKSPFTGDYEDPNHPGCLRQVKVVGAPLRGDGTRPVNPVMEIVGYDGNGSDKVCTERPTRADLWKIKGKVKSDTEVLIDFSPKGGPSDLVGKYDKDGIVFPDGNKWTKIPYGTPDRRPKDMSTLTAE